MKRVDSKFKNRVYKIVSQIPKGRVMTYGQVAAYCGAPWAAWEVGQIAHYGPPSIAWHRVVNKNGGLARGYTKGGYKAHKSDLKAENVSIDSDYRIINFQKILWQPPQNQKLLP